jgi:antitoxin component YwqK of YwqJK toxin-antitoxin module
MLFGVNLKHVRWRMSQRETKRICWPSGQLLAIAEVLNGKFDGLTRSFSLTGDLAVESHFKEGKAHGAFVLRWDNGNIREQGQYALGKRVGRYEWFERNGAAIRFVDYPSTP